MKNSPTRQPIAEEKRFFHWQEGMKFAHEGITSLMLLNGVATISVLTFIGNTASGDDRLVYAMFCFALGALVGPISFLFAYLTQLQYGNENMSAAWTFHRGTYCLVLCACLLFVAGVIFAGFAFIGVGLP